MIQARLDFNMGNNTLVPDKQVAFRLEMVNPKMGRKCLSDFDNSEGSSSRDPFRLKEELRQLNEHYNLENDLHKSKGYGKDHHIHNNVY